MAVGGYQQSTSLMGDDVCVCVCVTLLFAFRYLSDTLARLVTDVPILPALCLKALVVAPTKTHAPPPPPDPPKMALKKGHLRCFVKI